MKIKIPAILLLSFWWLTTSYAYSLNNRIIAHLEHTARSPMEITLLYHGKMLATVAYYGSSEEKEVGWIVQKKLLACENFDEVVPYLQVLRNGVPVNVVRYTCNPLGTVN